MTSWTPQPTGLKQILDTIIESTNEENNQDTQQAITEVRPRHISAISDFIHVHSNSFINSFVTETQ